MKNYVITENNVSVFTKALDEIIKWNNNNKLTLIAYDSMNHRKHMLLLHGLCKTYNESFQTVSFFEHNRFDPQFINNVDLKSNIVLAIQYIEKKSMIDKLVISESNLYDFYGINKKIILLELFSNVNSNNSLISKIDNLTIEYVNKLNKNSA